MVLFDIVERPTSHPVARQAHGVRPPGPRRGESEPGPVTGSRPTRPPAEWTTGRTPTAPSWPPSWTGTSTSRPPWMVSISRSLRGRKRNPRACLSPGPHATSTWASHHPLRRGSQGRKRLRHWRIREYHPICPFPVKGVYVTNRAPSEGVWRLSSKFHALVPDLPDKWRRVLRFAADPSRPSLVSKWTRSVALGLGGGCRRLVGRMA